jgi:hypothetical protein
VLDSRAFRRAFPGLTLWLPRLLGYIK